MTCPWTVAGKQASQPARQSTADAALEALHALVVNSKQRSNHMLCLSTLIQDLSTVVQSLKGHHSNQMTAGACLASLCLTEMHAKHVPMRDLARCEADVPFTRQFALTVKQGVFDDIVGSTHEAVLVSNTQASVILGITHMR